ncbi:potassium voltage-gated channel subfamily E member 4-like [Xyrauchen texanus]|uniref:potassium voltage-gated channel subfamily E member 4-like n=1 Tax=Xyrauchen texanus TaxID=154827 RepID=UPI002242B5CA|nr:potassium voltage-gated channel subfamily E member 4-like [Xyrauchen texanus]
MELARNVTGPDALSPQQTTGVSSPGGSVGNAYLYIVIVVSFYGVFLIGIMLVYMRTERREKKRSNAFTRLHEEEQREWGAGQNKQSLSLHTLRSTPVPFMLCAGRHTGCALEGGKVFAPLACALCSVEQSSVSSLSSTADVRFAIEEESDIGVTGEGPEGSLKTGSVSDHNSDGSSGENLKEAS